MCIGLCIVRIITEVQAMVLMGRSRTLTGLWANRPSSRPPYLTAERLEGMRDKMKVAVTFPRAFMEIIRHIRPTRSRWLGL
jgi:hypothetical protein